ncbi:MAG: ABC transporter permease, partial [Alphaproteobacteria bacterium]
GLSGGLAMSWRSVGARPHHVFSLFVLEAGFVSVLGAVLGVALLYAGMVGILPAIETRYGLFIAINPLSANEWIYLGAVVVAGLLAGMAPAIAAVRMSLADGMVVRS